MTAKDITDSTVPMMRILFVCMGNICRSPAAEVIFKNIVSSEHLDSQIEADSAGTIGYHQGEPPDVRMQKMLAKRGYNGKSLRARQIKPEDLDKFDLILTMDHDNYHEVKMMDRLKKFQQKIVPMCDFVKKFRETDVPDPYYGGQSGFEHVIDLLEDGCRNLLEYIKKRGPNIGAKA